MFTTFFVHRNYIGCSLIPRQSRKDGTKVAKKKNQQQILTNGLVKYQGRKLYPA